MFALELRRVLVVDDKPEVLRAVARMLAAFPLNVLTASTGADAVAIIQKSTPEVAIVDLFLEKDAQSGLKLVESMRAVSESVIIGVMSGAMTTSLRTACRDAGADWTLEKPFGRADLLEALLVHRVPTPTMLRTDLPLETIKQLYIDRVLEANEGNRSAAARVLGKRRTTLQRIIRRKSGE